MPTLFQINTTLNYGSTGRIAEQIAITAQRHGWDCVTAHGGRYVGKSEFPSILVGNKMDNYFHAFYGEFFGRHGLGSTQSTKRLIKKIKEFSPSLIHLHNIHGYYLNYKVLFDYFAEISTPIVWTLHDCWSFTGHCTHFENVGCEKWKTECNHCPLLMAQYKSRLIDRSRSNFLLKKELYAKLDTITIVPVSNWLASVVSQSILGKFPIKVIQNGVDLEVFSPIGNDIRAKYSISDNKMVVLSVMNGYDIEKGIEEINRIADEKDYTVIVVGLPNGLSNRISQKIINVGRTRSQSELAAYYSAADVFLNPTYNDTFPTTNIEALACGTPVITYRTGGSPEIIDEKTGIVVDKGDYSGLIKAIDMIQQKGKSAYTDACRLHAVEKYDKNERFMDYINLYNEILTNKEQR